MKALGAAFLAILVSCGQNPQPTLPEVPEIRLEGFEPAIRAEVERALEAARKDPRNPQANGDLAMQLHAHQQNAAAEAYYERARALAPERFDWVYLAACVRADQGKSEAAIANLRKALELQPGYTPAEIRLADLLLHTGAMEEAERLYRSVVEREPESALAWYGLGRAQASRGDAEAAAAAFEKALELYPEYGQAHYALAVAYRTLRRLDEAKEHFELGEKHKLEMPPSGDRVLNAVRSRTKSPTEYLRAGVELDRQGKLEESLAAHLEALKIAPDHEQIHINLISLYGRLGRQDRAEEHYRKAMALNENLPDAHYNYGVLMFQQGKLEEARQAFERAVEINPFYAKAHHNLGTLLESEGKLKEAAAAYEKAIENEPTYRLAHFHLGRILLNQGKAGQAIEHFERILEPEDEATPGYLYALGIAHAREGNRDRALRYIRQAEDRASAYHQQELLASIRRDLQRLEGRAQTP